MAGGNVSHRCSLRADALDRLSEEDADNAALENRLWDSADQFRANSGLKAQECSGPSGKVAAKFSALVADIIAQQQAFILQIQTLRRTRNLLLPRLLSGLVELETEAA